MTKVIHGNSEEAIVNVYSLAFTSSDGIINLKGAISMTVLLLVNIYFAGFSGLTVTSRIAYAMAWDGAIPFHKFFYSVNPATKSPVRVIFLVFFMDAALCLLPLGSTTAFAAITSIGTIGY